MNKISLKVLSTAAAAALIFSLTACSQNPAGTVSSVSSQGSASVSGTASSSGSLFSSIVSSFSSGSSETSADEISAEISSAGSDESTEAVSVSSSEISTSVSSLSGSENVLTANVTAGGAIDASDLFTERDLTQSADLSEAEYITVTDGQDISITKAGVYVLSGTASEVTVTVEADAEDKVQIVLDGVSITNSDSPCIYVKNADKVFITTTDSENTLEVNGTFTADGDTNTDAVIFSRDDLVLNGTGILNLTSTDNAVSSKDDIKVTGGTYVINCTSDAFEANDMISVADGNITVYTQKDGFHAENDEDDSQGSIYICGGTISISAGDDALHATCILQIDGGNITADAAEALEATWVQINDGSLYITASDDGINASAKSAQYSPTLEVNGGYVYVNMAAGDTDALDSNGYLYINGGTLDLYAQSPFDYDYNAEYNGGTIIVNGTETNSITSQFGGGMGQMPGDMGGGMPGEMGGGMPGEMGGQPGGMNGGFAGGMG